MPVWSIFLSVWSTLYVCGRYFGRSVYIYTYCLSSECVTYTAHVWNIFWKSIIWICDPYWMWFLRS